MEQRVSFQDEMYMIADELRSIADSGAHYAENDYDRARYARALSLSARIVAAIEQRSEDDVMAEYEESPVPLYAFRRRRGSCLPERSVCS